MSMKEITLISLQVGDESYKSFIAEKNGILSSLARRAKVSTMLFFLVIEKPIYLTFKRQFQGFWHSNIYACCNKPVLIPHMKC